MLVLAEFVCHVHSIIACSCHIYMGVILRAHPVHGESHNQRNINREVATTLVKCTVEINCQQLIHRQKFLKVKLKSTSPATMATQAKLCSYDAKPNDL